MSRELLISDPWSGEQCNTALLVYSAGFHFERAARLVKSRFSGATLAAAVPPSMAERARACPHVDKVIVVECERYRPVRDAAAILRMVKLLRRDRYDLAVVMFRSVKLGVLLYCLRARLTAVADMSEQLYPWRVGPLRAIAACVMTIVKRTVGTIAYTLIRLTVRLWRLTAS